MSLNYSIICFCIASIILNSCESDLAITHVHKININNSSIVNSVDISDLVDTISIIPLKEEPGELIGDIFKLLISENHYIIFDRLNTKKIFLFDKNGNYIKTIIKTGAAPDETLQLNDCWIKNSNELEVYDYSLKKIYQFDNTFNLKDKINCPDHYFIDNMKNIPNTHYYIGYSGYNLNPVKNKNYYKIVFFDDDLRIINTDLHYNRKFQGINWLSFRNHFFTYKDTLRFFEAYNNYIYKVSNTGLEKLYELNYKENNIRENKIDKIIEQNLEVFKRNSLSQAEFELKSQLLDGYASFGGQWLENENYIYFSTRESNAYFFSLYNKLTDQVEFNTRSLCEMERFKLNFPFIEYYDLHSDEFIGIIFGEDMNRCLLDDSKFRDEIQILPETFYIIKIKLK